MRLGAKVVRATGFTRHYIATASGPVELGPPARVEISDEEPSGYLLLHYDARGVCQADSWFASLEEAFRQAEVELSIPRDAWATLES